MSTIVGRWLVLSLSLLAACSGSTRMPWDQPPGPGEMYTHFNQVAEVHAAVIRGDMEAVRATASWFAEQQEMGDLPEGSEAYVEEMRRLARQAAQADRLEQAASATGRLGDTCGSCHTAFAVGPMFAVGSDPPVGEDRVSHMLRHRWATDRMWEGITGPSESAWLGGAKVLSSDFPLAGTEGKVHVLGERVHAIGFQATQATDPSDRARLCGELLATCAPCHEAAGVAGG